MVSVLKNFENILTVPLGFLKIFTFFRSASLSINSKYNDFETTHGFGVEPLCQNPWSRP